jgi:alpha-tubulin suppressor-like RCC1 family protein
MSSAEVLLRMGDVFYWQSCCNPAAAAADSEKRSSKSPRRRRSQSSPRSQRHQCADDDADPQIPSELDISQYLTKCPGDSVAAVAAGFTVSVVLTSKGFLYRWGVDNGKVFPLPTYIAMGIARNVLSVSCGRKHTLALLEGGVVMTWGTGYFGKHLVLAMRDNSDKRNSGSPRMLLATATQVNWGMVTT